MYQTFQMILYQEINLSLGECRLVRWNKIPYEEAVQAIFDRLMSQNLCIDMRNSRFNVRRMTVPQRESVEWFGKEVLSVLMRLVRNAGIDLARNLPKAMIMANTVAQALVSRRLRAPHFGQYKTYLPLRDSNWECVSLPQVRGQQTLEGTA